MTDTDWDVDEALASFTPNETVAKVCFDGQLTATIEQAEIELAGMATDDAGRAALAARIVAMTEELRSKERSFLIRAVGDLAWSNLLGQHAPGDEDLVYGYNHQTFPQAALAACCAEPKLTLEQAAKIRSSLAPSQWRRLWVAIRLVNDMGDGLGKSASDLAVTLASETKSSTATTTASPDPSSSGES